MCDWLCDFDVWNARMFRRGSFELAPLLPAAVLGCSNLCQTHSKIRLRWPKTAAAVRKRTAATRTTLADWVSSLPPAAATSAAFCPAATALEFAPALAQVLSPPPDTLDGVLLGKPKNQEAVEALVDTMLDYGVAYDLGAGQRLPGAQWGSDEGPLDGTPLKPPLHLLHAYASESRAARSSLPDAVRTMLLHKRQTRHAARMEQRAYEKSHALSGGPTQVGMFGGDRCAAHQATDPDEMGPGDMQVDSDDGRGAGGSGRRAQVAGGGLRGFLGLPAKSATDGSKQKPRNTAGTTDPGQENAGYGGSSTQWTQGGPGSGTSTQVRGAAGAAQAAIRAARAPKQLGKGKGNWLTTLGSRVMKERQRRVLVAEGEQLRLPAGVSACQSGKLHFAVTFKFNEGYTNAVKRPLQMQDLFPGMAAKRSD